MLVANIPKEKFSNTREYVYEVLRYNILNLTLKPGEQLSEVQLTKMLQVSRTPIREAIIRLVSDDLLRISPQVGTFVTKISTKEMVDATFVREMIETNILKIAIDLMSSSYIQDIENILVKQKETIQSLDVITHLELDQEFHHVFFRVVGNYTAWSVVKKLYESTQRERLLFLMTDNLQLEYVYNSHVELLEYVKKRDIDRAVQLMHDHIYKFANLAEEMKKKYPHYLE